MSQGVEQILRIPLENERLQAGLMVCAHTGSCGHRSMVPTMHMLRPSFVFGSMVADVGDFVGQCLFCVDSKAGELKPPPLGELVHGDGVWRGDSF